MNDDDKNASAHETIADYKSWTAKTSEPPNGYKQTDVGLIPEDWSVINIGELGTVVRGASPRPAGDPKYFNGNHIPWLTVAALTNIPSHQLHVNETAGYLTKAGAEHSRHLNAETVIIANSGATLGIAKILDIACCANDGIAAVINHHLGNKEFLCRYINTKTKHLREVVATGNGQPNLNTALIREFQLPFPPENEQTAIANALSDVDALLAKLDQLIAKKRDIKQGVMLELLTRKRRLPGFYQNWRHYNFGRIVNLQKIYTTPSSSNTDLMCIELEDIEPYSGKILKTSSLRKDASLKSIFHSGDVLFCKLRAYLRKYWLADKDGVCSTECWVLSPSEKINCKFLFQIIQQDSFIDAASTAYGTHMPRSDWKLVSNYKVALPPLDEQLAIAAILTDIDSEIIAIDQQRGKARQLKQGMMQQLLTGKIRLV